MKLPTYENKIFVVSSTDARVRQADNLLKEDVYKQGDRIPPGSAVGTVKRIASGTHVKVADLRVEGDRLVFVLVKAADAGAKQPAVWTRASNLEGGLLNELVSFAPGVWEAAPAGDNYTVTDPQAVIRGGAPAFASTGKNIPAGAFVVVKERTQDAKGKSFVKVSRAEIKSGKASAKESIGWTSAANLTDGCTLLFGTDDWKDEKGPNSCWDDGRYIGSKILVNIVGTNSQMEQITLESVPAYFELKDAAAKDGFVLSVNSGFRTFAHQVELRKIFERDGKPKAAKAGFSNHQHGKAFDLNTGGFDTPIYNWLKKNATAHGFVRTVDGEDWHWEPLPEIAARLRKTGEFKTFVGK